MDASAAVVTLLAEIVPIIHFGVFHLQPDWFKTMLPAGKRKATGNYLQNK